MKYLVSLILSVLFVAEIQAALFPRQTSGDGGILAPEKHIVRFQVPINVPAPNPTEEKSSHQGRYLDWGVLLLPPDYFKNDVPIRLVMMCHGAGGTVTGKGSQIENFPLAKYLVKEGFAVMDMAGLPEKFAEEFNVDPFNNMGSGIAVQSYIKGYNWIIDNYNIRKNGVHVWGGSMGGLTSNNLVYQSQIPVISHSAACPVTDLFNQAWLHPWSGNLPKIATAKLFGFDNEDVYEPEKVAGFNPILSNSWHIVGLRYKIHGVPLKIWHADEDPVVSFEGSVTFVEAIKRTGGRAELRVLHAKSHEPMDLGEPLKYIRYQNEDVPISPVVEEMVLWIKSFE